MTRRTRIKERTKLPHCRFLDRLFARAPPIRTNEAISRWATKSPVYAKSLFSNRLDYIAKRLSRHTTHTHTMTLIR